MSSQPKDPEALNTISDKDWISLQRRRAQAMGKEDVLSKKATEKRISGRQQRQLRRWS